MSTSCGCLYICFCFITGVWNGHTSVKSLNPFSCLFTILNRVLKAKSVNGCCWFVSRCPWVTPLWRWCSYREGSSRFRVWSSRPSPPSSSLPRPRMHRWDPLLLWCPWGPSSAAHTCVRVTMLVLTCMVLTCTLQRGPRLTPVSIGAWVHSNWKGPLRWYPYITGKDLGAHIDLFTHRHGFFWH